MPDRTKIPPDPFAAGVHQDPYPIYRQLRESAAVHPSALRVPAYYRHADCAAILRDPRWGRGFSEQRLQWSERPGISPMFLHQNPPEHTRLRGLVTKAFTPRSIAGMRPHIEEICDRLLDSALAEEETDLISAYAYPLPVTVISELLGVPVEDRELFYSWSRALARSLDPDFTMTAEMDQQRRAAILDLRAYFAELASQRRACPADDLITRLTKVQENGNLSDADLLATCVLILVAGHETTVNLIGNGMLALLRNPGQLAMVREARPENADTWIDELLRYDAPVQVLRRTALEDLEYGGRTYKRGDAVAVVIGSANHDAAVFSDPEVLDVARPNNHLSFGLGIHFCLGASLARLEGSLAITTLLRRAPELCLTEADPPYRENIVLRGLDRLPVRFRQRRPSASAEPAL